MTRPMAAWITVATLILGQVVAPVAWAAQDVSTLRTDNAAQVGATVTAIKAGLEGVNQPAPTKVGMEEAVLSPLALQLPDRFGQVDVLGQLSEALKDSPFLNTLRGFSERRGFTVQLYSPVSPLPSYRFLDKSERTLLEQQRVAAENWDHVIVPEAFGADDIARMYNVRLQGYVQLGLLRGQVAFGEVRLDAVIENTTLDTVIVGNHVFIQNNTLINRYVIADGAKVFDNGMVTTDQGTTFGLGAEIPVGPETGGREVKAYPEISFEAIVRLARSRGDRGLQDDYAKLFDQYVEQAKSDFGYIGQGAELSSVPRAKNLFLSDGAVFAAVPTLENVIALSADGEQTSVVGAQSLKNTILQLGVSVETGAVVGDPESDTGVILLEHSHALNHAKVKASVIGPNTGVGEAEVTSSLIGPFVGIHHMCIVIAMDWAEGMGNVGAGAQLGSNHTGRAPDQEMRAGEGTFFGLGVLHTFSANFTEAPYSLLAKGVKGLPQRVQMPFSLINVPSNQIPGVSPAYGEMMPAWVWSDNAYMVMRNEGKYASRDHAKRHRLGRGDLQRYPFEVLRPSIVNLMIRARDALQAVNPGTAFMYEVTVGGKTKTIRYYTDRQIPGLGKNYMTEENRVKAIAAYTRMIQYYALKGLFAEVQARVDEVGRLNEMNGLLTTPSDNVRWEHERRTLLSEVTTRDIPAALREYAAMQRQLAADVLASKKKDDNRGPGIIDDYAEAHGPAEKDKFVVKTQKDAEELAGTVERLVGQLSGVAPMSPAPRAAEPARFPVASLVQAQKAIIVMPEGLPVLSTLALVQPEGGWGVPVIAIVRDEQQAQDALADLVALGVTPEAADGQVIRLRDDQAPGVVASVQRKHYLDEGYGPLIVVGDSTNATMQMMATFLGIPSAEIPQFLAGADSLLQQAIDRYL